MNRICVPVPGRAGFGGEVAYTEVELEIPDPDHVIGEIVDRLMELQRRYGTDRVPKNMLVTLGPGEWSSIAESRECDRRLHYCEDPHGKGDDYIDFFHGPFTVRMYASDEEGIGWTLPPEIALREWARAKAEGPAAPVGEPIGGIEPDLFAGIDPANYAAWGAYSDQPREMSGFAMQYLVNNRRVPLSTASQSHPLYPESSPKYSED